MIALEELDDPLPDMCAVSGVATTERVPMRFAIRSEPHPATMLLGLPYYAIAKLRQRRTWEVDMPISPAVLARWKGARWFVAGLIVAGLIFIALGIAAESMQLTLLGVVLIPIAPMTAPLLGGRRLRGHITDVELDFATVRRALVLDNVNEAFAVEVGATAE